MDNRKKTNPQLVLLAIGIMIIAGGFQSARSQELRWLRVGQLENFIVDYGAENELTPLNYNSFRWPALYGDNQHTSRAKGLWLGATSFYDPVQLRTKAVKVVSTGPRYDAVNQPLMVFSRTIKLIAKTDPPRVTVDGLPAANNALYDTPDEIDPNLPCDRMVVITFNTSLGVSVTKKVMAFAQQNHDNYFIYDYVFKNTGIYNEAGNIYTQTLNNFRAFFNYRYAFAGVTSTGYNSTWGAFSSEWGGSTSQHDFGPFRSYNVTSIPNFYRYCTLTIPDSVRGFYAYYAPHKDRSGISYNQDWGCPNQNGGGPGLNGLLGSAKYAGCVTLFASQSPANYSVDDPNQPQNTTYSGPDEAITASIVSQYDDVFMQNRWSRMIDGHLANSMEELVGTQYVSDWNSLNSARPGGQQNQGYGPYTLQPNDSIHIVFAEGVSGISWDKCREVGANWYEYYKGTSSPTLTLPNGSTTTDYLDYTRGWVQTGRDSLLQTFLNAIANYRSGFNIIRPPDPPSSFTVSSGGDQILLTWTPPANTSNLAGYVIYRSEGDVKDYRTNYTKVYECDASVNSWGDTTAVRGFHYFYYIQSRDNGTRNVEKPGVPLYSSPFLTLPSSDKYAKLLRPSGNLLGEVRVVPNPYDIRSRTLQFATGTGQTGGIDQISFYGLPPVCKLSIYTEDGTLVWQKDHTNGSGDEDWNSQTSSGQIIASGIYILYVQVNNDIYATQDKIARYDIYDENLKLMYPKDAVMFQAGEKIYSAGQSTIRKFVVIR